MKLLRAILTAIVLWILIFFEVSILMFGFKMTTGALYYTIHYVFLVIITAIASLIYFKKAEKGAPQGLLLGIFFLVVGTILDALITVQLFVHNYSFFASYYLWIGYGITLLMTILIGAVKK
jgi:phosphoglycerol transferase MdoB-like AlkP superfamily enzyme